MNWIPRVPTGARRASHALAVLALLLALPGVAGARTFAAPHVFEQKGRISTTTNTFDTNLYVTYASGLAGQPSGPDHQVSLWLYAPDGSPMRAFGGQSVCQPCAFTLSEGGGGLPGTRKLSIPVDDLIEAHGGFGVPPSSIDGFAVVDISNDGDPNSAEVVMRTEVTHANTGPFDQAVWSMDGADPCPSSGGGTSSRVFVLPHVLEKSGLAMGATGTPYTFDTSIFMTYTAGLGGKPPGGGATVDLYLFDNDGSLMGGSLGPVCAPCTYDFSSLRKHSIVVDNLIAAKGGYSTPVRAGFGIIVVSGDADNVAIQGFVVNSHTSPFDLSVFGFEPQPIAAATAATVPPLVTGDLVLELSSRPNPSRGGMDFGFDLARATRVDLGVYDAAGRKVATVYSGNREAGRHTLRWNRQDDAGNTLPAGVYFGRLAAGDGTGLSRIVVLPE
jgi:hypothetical protein